MKENLQQNLYSTEACSQGIKRIMEWEKKVNDSLNTAYFKDSVFFNQNLKTIDSLKNEISKHKNQLDLLIGIK